MSKELIGKFTVHEEYRTCFNYSFQYCPADDGPEVDVINIERINELLDIADDAFYNF
jgi:hypothetical protein